jgi:hypothetical protein
MKTSLFYRLIAVVLACNYFAFQVEVFEEEYEANHRPISPTSAIASPTLTWESFDKTNAPKAFVFNAEVTIELLLRFEASQTLAVPPIVTLNPIRDKSPPLAVLT